MAETMTEASVDEQGKAIALGPVEALRRAERGVRARAAIEEIGDEEDHRAALEALLKALDDGRPAARERSA